MASRFKLSRDAAMGHYSVQERDNLNVVVATVSKHAPFGITQWNLTDAKTGRRIVDHYTVRDSDRVFERRHWPTRQRALDFLAEYLDSQF